MLALFMVSSVPHTPFDPMDTLWALCFATPSHIGRGSCAHTGLYEHGLCVHVSGPKHSLLQHPLNNADVLLVVF